MKVKALRKHRLHEKTAASVVLKPFINSNKWCSITVTLFISNTLLAQTSFKSFKSWGFSILNYPIKFYLNTDFILDLLAKLQQLFLSFP